MTTQTLTAPVGDWISLGSGPLLVSSLTTGAVCLRIAATKPAVDADGHILGDENSLNSVSLQTCDIIWARGVDEAEQIVVTRLNDGAGVGIPNHDYAAFTYSGGNVATATYKVGGANGTTVAALAFTYDGDGNVLTITRS